MKILILGLIYFFTVICGGFIIGKTCKSLGLPKNDNRGMLKAGKFIGYFERFIILTCIIINIYEPVGLLFVGKSIIRFLTGRKASIFWSALLQVFHGQFSGESFLKSCLLIK